MDLDRVVDSFVLNWQAGLTENMFMHISWQVTDV